MGFSNDEWGYLAKAAEDHGADMLELNFSCPHMTVEGSGHKVGQANHLLEKFTATVKKAVKIPVLAKMTPNITDMTEPALFAKKGGADGISAVNTFRAISGIGLDDLVPKPNVFGVGAMSGYSGAAIKPIALHFIAEMAQCAELGLPLSAMGGDRDLDRRAGIPPGGRHHAPGDHGNHPLRLPDRGRHDRGHHATTWRPAGSRAWRT